MSWEQRLRDMILAGGALAATGCDAPSVDAPSDASDAPSDAASVDASSDLQNPFGGFMCCNANYDPCCLFLHCGGPMTAACACEMDAACACRTNPQCSCQTEGGIWISPPPTDPTLNPSSTVGVCSLPLYDDAGVLCCEAGADLCCSFLHCGAPLTPDCCLSAGGTSAIYPDGNILCSAFPQEAGPGDADADAD